MSRHRFSIWRVSLLLLCVALLPIVAHGQTGAKPLTDDDVIAMVKGGLAESTVINAIEAQETNFDVSVAALIKLKQQGVSSKIMDAMLSASGKRRDSAGASGTGLVSSAPAPAIASSTASAQAHADISGVYTGQFRCVLAKFDLKLSVAAGDTGSLTAVFDFSPLGPASGQQQLVFDLRGSYEPNTQKFQLTPVRWETTPPQGYQMVGMSGTYDAADQRLNGRFSNPLCGTFHLARDHPQSAQSLISPLRPRTSQSVHAVQSVPTPDAATTDLPGVTRNQQKTAANGPDKSPSPSTSSEILGTWQGVYFMYPQVMRIDLELRGTPSPRGIHRGSPI